MRVDLVRIEKINSFAHFPLHFSLAKAATGAGADVIKWPTDLALSRSMFRLLFVDVIEFKRFIDVPNVEPIAVMTTDIA